MVRGGWRQVLVVTLAAILALAVLMLRPSRPEAPPAPTPAPAPGFGIPFEPLQPGLRLTYERVDGGPFYREVMRPVRITWFDGSLVTVVPVYDQRLDGFFLFRNQAGSIQVVGSWHQGRLERWGEYTEVINAGQTDPVEPLTTKAGTFPRTLRLGDERGPLWFAEGLGLVKSDQFELVQYQYGPIQDAGLPGEPVTAPPTAS